MLFLFSLALTILPLLGIVYIAVSSPSLVALATVDNLFTAIMLATMSGIFGLDVLLALKENGWRPPLGKFKPATAATVHGQPVMMTRSGAVLESGIVESVGYFESTVGQPNRLVLTLRDNGTKPRVLVFNGDLRDQFPVGRRVAIKYRPEEEANTLLERRYE
ncbi:MAG: hypothetical protein AB7O65_02370 [Candidatus Korobacteraceae bacterium]